MSTPYPPILYLLTVDSLSFRLHLLTRCPFSAVGQTTSHLSKGKVFLRCVTHCSGSLVGEDLDEDFDGDCEGALGLRADTPSRLGASAGPTDPGRLMGDEDKENCFSGDGDFEIGAWPVMDGVFRGESERAGELDSRGEND